ncbi:MAG: hypothetical protein AB8H03_22015 [Saprospiraceae bacterium]
MKSHHWIFIMCLLFATNALYAQVAMMEKRVTIQYFNVELEEALEGISEEYDVNFTYSIDRISVDQIVSADVENIPLSLALEELLEETDITYANIGDQVILKVDLEKRKLLAERRAQKKVIPKPKPAPPKWVKQNVTMPLQIANYHSPTKYLEEPEYEMGIYPVWDPFFYNVTLEEEIEFFVDEIFEESPDGEKVAQITLFGNVGTNMNNNSTTTNKVSANILWGHNGGVNGTEVGGLVNAVVNDVKGIQVAGVGNVVGGEVEGTQVGGVFNVNKGTTKGIQAAGIINVGRKIKGVQAAGILNVAGKGSDGIQAAGIGNIAGRESKGGMQAAGIFNINGGKTNLQVAPIINIGRNVKGCQIGLINIADSIGGASIGLINIVRNGYNRVEFSGADVLYFNAELKLGSKGFYNIFHAGFRPLNKDEGHYAFGYGFGTFIRTKKKRLSHNLEILATQILDVDRPADLGAPSSKKLNLLNQFRWTIDFRIGRQTSLFFGPTFNVMVSKLVDQTTNEYALDILPYTIFEQVTTDIEPTYLAGWVGFNAGIRF